MIKLRLLIKIIEVSFGYGLQLNQQTRQFLEYIDIIWREYTYCRAFYTIISMKEKWKKSCFCWGWWWY